MSKPEYAVKLDEMVQELTAAGVQYILVDFDTVVIAESLLEGYGDDTVILGVRGDLVVNWQMVGEVRRHPIANGTN
jgi:hypothetical protein